MVVVVEVGVVLVVVAWDGHPLLSRYPGMLGHSSMTSAMKSQSESIGKTSLIGENFTVKFLLKYRDSSPSVI